MKLLIAAVTFAATLGILLLIETGKSPKEDYAQIIEALKEGNASTTVLVIPSPNKARTPTPASTSTPIPTPTPTPSPAPQNGSTAKQTPAIPTPTQTPIKTLSPTPPPASPLPSSAPSTTLALTPTPSATPEPTPEQSEKININTAGAEESDNITGVGPAYAKNIIDYRNANGPFQKIEDIINVRGIGPKTFEKMKDEIIV